MHYKNGRLVSVGDWAVGPTHNSEQKIVIGLVVEVMEKQGNCNVRLAAFRSHDLQPYSSDDERDALAVRMGKDNAIYKLGCHYDYADAKNLVHVHDGYDMVDRVAGDKYPTQMA